METHSLLLKLDIIHRNYTMLSNEVNTRHSKFRELAALILAFV